MFVLADFWVVSDHISEPLFGLNFLIFHQNNESNATMQQCNRTAIVRFETR